MNKIYVLYLGEEDWSKTHDIPEHIEFTFCKSIRSFPVELKKRIADVVILDRNIQRDELDTLCFLTRGYCLFVTEHVDKNESCNTSYFERKMGQYLYSKDIDVFLATEASKFYEPPYGEKYSPNALVVSQFFRGKVSSQGNYNLLLEGDFGEEFSQIAFWRNTLPLFANQVLDLYLEYRKTGNVEICLRVIQFYNGSADMVRQIWEFDEEALKDVVTIGNQDEYGPFFVSILAKGKGSLQIISLHDRHSRQDRGYFIPGGNRLTSPEGEELFSYFEKGDGKPPFAVYFSGYRQQEGFEGYYMMRNLGCPFILFTDPRSEGGAFYVGNEAYESLIVDEIREKMETHGFTKKDLVLSGASMGTYGSLYYGSQLEPHALILAKPLTNMGTVAKNERILRTEGFATSLDVLMKNYGSIDENAIQAFDERLWKHFVQADWSQTKFIVSYLYEDDYDPDGYRNLLTHLKSEGVQVYGKGNHGRHTDNSFAVMEWFKSQYHKVLKEDYHR